MLVATPMLRCAMLCCAMLCCASTHAHLCLPIVTKALGGNVHIT